LVHPLGSPLASAGSGLKRKRVQRSEARSSKRDLVVTLIAHLLSNIPAVSSRELASFEATMMSAWSNFIEPTIAAGAGAGPHHVGISSSLFLHFIFCKFSRSYWLMTTRSEWILLIANRLKYEDNKSKLVMVRNRNVTGGVPFLGV
jgi:hypothetical protein